MSTPPPSPPSSPSSAADPPLQQQPPLPQPPLHQSPEPLRAAVRANPAGDGSARHDARLGRERRWRAVWQLPLLWGVPALPATGWMLAHGGIVKPLFPLIGAGVALPVFLGVRRFEAVLLLGLVCGLAIFAAVGFLYDVLVRYRAGDGRSWWDRNWMFFLMLCLTALALSSANDYRFDGWCFAYHMGVMLLAAIVLATTLIWAVCRLARAAFVRGDT